MVEREEDKTSCGSLLAAIIAAWKSKTAWQNSWLVWDMKSVTKVRTLPRASIIRTLRPSLARKVAEGDADRGILVCGTGIGMSIAANKFPGIRAAICNDAVTAEISRRHNDVNVLCLAGDLLGQRNIDRLIEIWIETKFEGGRHARRLEKIARIDRRCS